MLKHIFKLKKPKISALKIRLIGLFILFCVFVTFYTTRFFTFQRNAQASSWFDDSFLYRQVVIATNNSTSSVVNVPYRISLNTATLISAGKMKSNGDDIRIFSNTGAPVRFQIEQSTINTSTTGIWFEATVSAGQSATYFLYYGNNATTKPVFQSDVSNVTGSGATVDMLDGFSYDTNTSYGRLSDIRIGGANIGVNGSYRHSTAYPGNWWDDRAFTRTLLASGPLFVEVRFTDTNYGSYSSFGTSIMMFDNGFVANRAFMTYNTSGSDQLYYYLEFDTGTRNSVYVNNAGTLVDIDADSGVLGPSNLGRNWFGQRWTATGNYGGTIINNNGADWVQGQTSTRNSYYQTNYSSSLSYTNGSSREIRWATFAGNGGGSEMSIKGSTYGANTVTIGSEQKSKAPAAYWKFDEGFGTITYSSIGGVTGSLSGPTWQAEDACVTGKCLYFDGVNDSISISNSANVNIVEDISVSAWIKPKTPEAQGVIVHKDLQYTLIMRSNKSVSWADSSNYSYANFGDHNIGIETGKWNHITVTKTGGVVKIYLNGVEKVSKSFGGSLTSTANNTFIGCYAGASACSSSYFAGHIDEVKIYPWALSVDAVKSNYLRGAGSSGGSAATSQANNDPVNNGLVAYWKMDEASANTCSGGVNDSCDSSGNGFNGAWNGNATNTAGKFGNGVSLDGSGDYIGLGTFAPTTSTSHTFSTWVKSSAGATLNSFLFDSAIGRLVIGWNGIVSGKLGYYDSSGNWRNSSVNAPNDGAWHHVVFVLDGSKNIGSIYINGVLRETNLLYTPTVIGNTAAIGGRYSGDNYFFNGQIDEFRLYNRALSDAEVASLYNWAPGPIAYWKMDENTGTTANDTSGNGNTATLNNGPTWTNGKFGSGISLDGSNDFISANDSTSLDISKEFTVSGWIKLKQLPSVAAKFIGKWNETGNQRSYILGLNSTNILGYVDFAGSWGPGQAVTSNTYVSLNQWAYVSYVYDGAFLYLYLDGVRVATPVAYTNTVFNGTSKLIVGGSGGEPFSGQNGYLNADIDEVKIYNYARTQAQVLQDMGAVTSGANTNPLPTPVAHWKFDEGYGTTANNSGNGGTNYSGVLRNSPTLSNSGIFQKAISLDGLNDYVEAPINLPLKYTGGDFSFSTWVFKDVSETDGGAIISRPWNGLGQYNYNLGIYSNSTFGITLTGATTWQTTTISTLPTGVWKHLVVTINGTTKQVNIYMDGILIKSDTHNITNWTPSSGDASLPLAIGTLYPYGNGWAGNSSFSFGGKIDDTKIYTSALTADQVKVDFNQGKSQVLGSVSTESNGVSPSFSASRAYCVPGDTTTCNPPIAEWNFDEGTGTTANDTSGNNNSGTLTNGPISAAGRLGASLSFDGVDDSVIKSDNATLDITNAITISAWIKPIASDANGTIVTKLGAYYLERHSDNKLQVYFYGLSSPGYHQSTVIIPNNSWSFVTVTYDGSSIRLYVDGALNREIPSITGSITNSASSLFVGSLEPGGSDNYEFTGFIDHVKIYNYARTPAQIAWEYNRGEPTIYYKFDECQGSEVFNSAISANQTAVGTNGTITIGSGGAQTSVGTCQTSGARFNGATGKISSALSLDGTDDYVVVSTLPIPSGTNNFTISGWIRPSTSHYGVIAGPEANGSDNWIAYDGANSSLQILYTQTADVNNVSFNTPTGSVPVGSWSHFTVTIQNNVVKVYINGSLVQTSTAAFTIGSWRSRMNIGNRRPLNQFHFNGLIDEIKIHNYVMTDTQVKSSFNNSAVSF
jgi:hypothetical protein